MIRGPPRSGVATQSWMLVTIAILLAALLDIANARQPRSWKRLDFREHLSHSSSSSRSPSFFCSKEGYFRHPEDCHSYIRCVDDFGLGRNFKAIEVQCKPGLVFDEEINTCNWPELSQPCVSSLENRRPFRPEKVRVTQKPRSTLTPIQHEVKDQSTGNNRKNPPRQQQQDQQVTEQPKWQKEKEQQQWPQEKEQQQWPQEKEQQQWPQEKEQQQWPQEKEQQQWPQEKEQQQWPQEKEQWQQEQQREQERNQQEQQRKQQQEQQRKQQQREQQKKQQQREQQIKQQQREQQIKQQQREQQRKQQHEQQRKQQHEQQRKQQQQREQHGEQQQQREQQRKQQQQQQEQGLQQQQEVQRKKQHDQQKQQQESFPEQQKVFNEQTIKNPSNTRFSQSSSKPNNIKQVTVSRLGQQNKPEILDEEERIPVVCNGEGFFRSPSNCSHFYRCVTRNSNGFSVHPFTCPKSLVFNPAESACSERYKLDLTDKCRRNANRRNKRSNGGGRRLCDYEGYFRHPKDCRAFYRCVENPERPGTYQTHFFSCPATLVFDEEASTCNWPHQAAPCDNIIRRPQKATSAPRKPASRPTPQRPVSSTRRPIDKRKPQNNPPSSQKPQSTTSRKSATSKTTSSSRITPSPPRGTSKRPPASSKKQPTTTRNKAQPPAPRKPQSGQRKNIQKQRPQNDENSSTENREQNQSDSNEPKCETEGYYRHPKDCNKFYRCVDMEGEGKSFTRYDFICPEGLVFDEKNSVCNWPDQAEPCNGAGDSSGNDGDLESEDGSSSTTDGTQEAGEGTEETDSNPEDGGGSDESGSDEDGSEESAGDGQQPGGEASTGNDGNCNKEGYFRHPEDCNKFYRCVDFEGDGKSFTRYDFNCPEGLVFDEVNSVCNWPEQSAPCDGGDTQTDTGESKPGEESQPGSEGPKPDQSSETPSSGTPDGQEGSSEESEITTESGISSTADSSPSSEVSSTDSSTSNGEKEPGNESGECTEEGYFRDPEDCNKFYRCVDFKGDGQSFVRYDFECPEGLVFDEVNSVCNWPDQSPACDSGGSSGTDTTDSSSAEGGSQSSTETSTSKEPTSSSTASPESESSSTTKESETTNESGETTTSGESSSSTKGESEISTTDSESSTQSGSSGQGSSTTDQASTSSGDSKIECTEEGYFRHPDDCSKFYRCVDFQGDGRSYTRYDFECPEGLVFDEVNSVCNWPNQSPPCESDSSGTDEKTTSDSTSVDSTTKGTETTSASSTTTQKSTTSETESSSDTTESGSTSVDSTTKGTETTSASSTTTQKSTTSETESSSDTTESGSTSGSESSTTSSTNDACEKEGFFRDSNDCNKFYRCVEVEGQITRYDFECPQGLIFQESSEKCEYPTEEDKDCSSTEDSSTTATSSTPVDKDSSSSSTSSSNTEECQEEGFFRDPDDCRRYYRCLDENKDGNLVKTEYSCEEGEYFDEEMRFCNRADPENPCQAFEPEKSTTPSSGTTSASSTLKPTESSTTSEETSETTSAQISSTQQSSSTSTGTEDSGTTSSSTSTGTEDSRTTSSSTSTGTEDSGTTSSSTSTGTEDSGTTSSSMTTSEKSGADSGKIECTSEGFFRHPEDCNKFYRCVDFRGDGQSYVRYDFDCPEGLVFDEVNSVCNWPQQSPPCESGSSSSSSSQSTTSGEGDESTSGSTTDDRGTTKSSASTTASTEGTNDVTESSSSDNTQSSSGVTESSKSTTQSGASTTSKSGGNSGKIECTEEGFFRNPDDCNKFYRCVDFRGDGQSYVRYDFDCPEGLVFDEVNSVCNWPQQTPACETRGAGDGTGDENKETSETTDSSTDEEQESSETANTATTARLTSTTSEGDEGSSESESSADQCKEEGFFRDPNDCTRYIRCEKNEETGELTRTEHQCPDDHVFDEEGRYCNSAEFTPCEGNSGDNDTSGTTASSQGTDSGEFQCQEEGFFRDPDDCGAYYQCKAQEGGGFEKSHVQCPKDHIFDEEGRYCNAEELLPDEKSCRKNQPTDSDGKQSTGNEKGTTPSSGTSSGDDQCNEEGFFRNPDDCTRYYQCSKSENGSGYDRKDFQCPDDRIFDEEGRYCNEEELIEGEQSCKGEPTTNNEDASTTGGGRESPPTESSQGTSATSKPNRNRGQGDCTEEGFFRNPNDCNKFYRCVDFRGDGQSYVRYDFDCPENLVFDEVNSVCNWPTMTPACESAPEDEGVPPA